MSKRASGQTDGKIFNSANAEWGERRATLKSLLTDDEYTAAQASAFNAHYTSSTVIRTIYQGLDNLGFHRSNILKSSYDAGNFLDMLPERMQTSHLFAVELDGITGHIGSLGDVPADGRILLPQNAFT